MIRDTEHAAAFYDELRAFEQMNIVIGIPAAVSLCGAHHLAMLAAVLGRWDDHERHVADAYAMYERMGDPPWRMLLDGTVAVDLIRRGRPDDLVRARDLLSSAIERGREIGVEVERILTPVMDEVRPYLQVVPDAGR